jgi:hypothetical protein
MPLYLGKDKISKVLTEHTTTLITYECEKEKSSHIFLPNEYIINEIRRR